MHHLTPHFIIEKFEQGLLQGDFPAVGLFVDISGFTKVTESLMQYQQYGVEELAKVMRAIFCPLADSIYDHGGFICTCAGDAITALFPLELKTEPSHTYYHALAAAYTIRQQMVAYPSQTTRYGTFQFTAKIGLGDGQVEWGIFSGSTPQQNAYYFKGSAIESCVQAENRAAGNEIVLSKIMYHQLAPAIDIEPVKDDSHFVKLNNISISLPQAEPINLPEITLAQAAAFHPKELIQQAEPGEFRHALNVFINLTEIKTHHQLANIMQIIFRLQQQYGGYLNRADFGDKGCHLLLFWGAPVAFETDVERSLNFLLDLQAVIETPMRAGVTYRISHAGFIGTPWREEYTCYGRGINLAARQMTHAPWGDIWLDEEMAQRASHDFIVEFVDQLNFKGFAEPMAVYRLEGRQEFVYHSKYEDDIRIIGRQAELGQLKTAIELIYKGQFAGVITVLGEAGLGKSRLIYELHRLLIEKESDVNNHSTPLSISQLYQKRGVSWFHCPADEILHQPLNPFRYWLRYYFQQVDSNSKAQNKIYFNQIFDSLTRQTTDPILREELSQLSSYLGALVDLYWPDSPYDHSDPKLRFENTLRAIKNLIKAESLRRPVIIEIEDAHWLDPQSKEMLTLLTRNIDHYPIAIICVTRYDDDGTKPTLPLDTDVLQQTVELTYFAQDNVKFLAESLLQGQISEYFSNFLAEKSHGNPFFVKQLILDLQERGALVQKEQSGQRYCYLNLLYSEDVPTNIRTVLVSRLDRLPQPVKQIIQVASVLGPEFDVQVLAKILPEDQHLEQHLQQAEDEQIWVRLTGNRYLFKHALLRDSAYSMQVRSRLRILHQQGAEALESLYAPDLSRHYTALAYHYEQSELSEKSIVYLEQAGNQAKANYQNEEALDFYERLLNYPVGRDKEMIIYSKQGEILNLLGRWDLALEKLQKGLDKLNGLVNTIHGARLNVVLGDVLLTKGMYDQAQKHLQNAQHISQMVADNQTLFKCFITLARNCMYKLEPEQALNYNQKALVLAQELDDDHGAAMAMAGIGAVHAMRDESKPALDYLLKAIPIFKKLGDKREMIHPIFNAGLVYHIIGEYDLSLDYFQQVITEAVEIGDRVGVWLALHFIGHIHHSSGRHEQAIPIFQEALQKRAETGEDGLISQTEPYLATAYASLARHPEALSTALQYFKKLVHQQRDVEQGRAHVAVGMVLGQLTVENESLDNGSFNKRNGLTNLANIPSETRSYITAISQVTQLPVTPHAYFNYAIQSAQSGSRPYPMTLIPALYEYGRFLYRIGQVQAALAKLTEAKKQALQLGMQGKLNQIKRVCADLSISFEALG